MAILAILSSVPMLDIVEETILMTHCYGEMTGWQRSQICSGMQIVFDAQVRVFHAGIG
jgi:hypothetical protein